jgi:hypothetical protein
MPLQNNEYQIVTAQTVKDLLYIPQLCTNMGMDFLKSEWAKQDKEMQGIALDVFTGRQILGLIGISNPKLQPQLEYLSPTGLGLYKVPLRGVSQYCIGGNYPSVQFMKTQLKNNFVPEMLRQAQTILGLLDLTLNLSALRLGSQAKTQQNKWGIMNHI